MKLTMDPWIISVVPNGSGVEVGSHDRILKEKSTEVADLQRQMEAIRQKLQMATDKRDELAQFHEEGKTAAQVKKETPCKFFAVGTCTRKDRCAFSHDAVGTEDSETQQGSRGSSSDAPSGSRSLMLSLCETIAPPQSSQPGSPRATVISMLPLSRQSVPPRTMSLVDSKLPLSRQSVPPRTMSRAVGAPILSLDSIVAEPARDMYRPQMVRRSHEVRLSQPLHMTTEPKVSEVRRPSDRLLPVLEAPRAQERTSMYLSDLAGKRLSMEQLRSTSEYKRVAGASKSRDFSEMSPVFLRLSQTTNRGSVRPPPGLPAPPMSGIQGLHELH